MRDNPMMGRKEVAFEVEEKATPSRADLRRELSVMLRAEPDKIWVRRMVTRTGTHTSVGLAHVYGDAERALRTEPDHIVKRNQPKAAEGSEENKEKEA